MTSKAGSVTYLEKSTVSENMALTTVEEAVNETRARVKFLLKFAKSSPKSYITKDSRDVIWKINKCYFDWKKWRPEISAALCEEGFPEAAMIITKNTIGKITTGKDDGVYKLLRNSLGSTANFSEFKEFRQQLTKVGAIEIVMGFLSQEASKKKDPKPSSKPDENSDTFLLRSSLQMMLNILKSPTFANDFLKIGAMNTFANLMDIFDDDVRCMTSLCLLKLLNSKTPVPKFVDDKNVNLVFIKALSAELKHGSSQREFRIPIEAIIDGLVFIGQNEANMKKLLQNGVVNSICELLSASKNEAAQLRGVELFLSLFAERQKLCETALTSIQFKTICSKISAMNSTSVETMPILKAKKVLSNMKQLRNDSVDDVTSDEQDESPPGGQSQSPTEKAQTNETLLQAEDQQKNSTATETHQFKDNDLIYMLEDAMSETRLRVNFLENLNHLSPTSLVCPESSKAVDLLNDSYSAWDSAWRLKIIQVLLQENYPDVALTFSTFLLKQNLDSSESTAFRMIVNLYIHISNITDSSIEGRLAFGKAGFIPFLLSYLNKINPSKQLTSSTSDLVQKSIFILYNLSRSPELKSDFVQNDAANILAKYLNFSNLLILIGLCLAHVLSDTPEAVKMVDERGVVKSVIDLAITASNEVIRKAYVSGVGLFSLDELMDGLCLLAVSDGNKKTIMNNGGVDLLGDLLGSDKPGEQISALDLMWTLSFEKSARNAIRNEKDTLMKPLRNLTLSEDAEVKKCAKRTLNFIEKWEKVMAEASSQAAGKDNSREGGHVFLSYSWKQQETVLRIKTMLTNKGYRVWMDVDKMHGDLIEKMAQAVENASVVLICFSNSYKMSNACRAEAQYAHILSKPIVPVNMDYHFFPDGWLGIIVRAKKFVDMSLEKYPFEEAFTQLIQELQALGEQWNVAENGRRKSLSEVTSTLTSTPASSNQQTPQRTVMNGFDTTKAAPNTSPSNISAIAKWSKADVKKWLQQEKLQQKFGPKLEEFDGEKLAMLLEIEKKAPEYYYTAVTKHISDTLPNMLQLFAALSRLSSSTEL